MIHITQCCISVFVFVFYLCFHFQCLAEDANIFFPPWNLEPPVTSATFLFYHIFMSQAYFVVSIATMCNGIEVTFPSCIKEKINYSSKEAGLREITHGGCHWKKQNRALHLLLHYYLYSSLPPLPQSFSWTNTKKLLDIMLKSVVLFSLNFLVLLDQTFAISLSV